MVLDIVWKRRTVLIYRSLTRVDRADKLSAEHEPVVGEIWDKVSSSMILVTFLYLLPLGESILSQTKPFEGQEETAT